MIKRDVSKSKEFREKEEKLLENVRLKNERELIGDCVMLLEEKLYCNVTFIVKEVEFPAHVAVLHARAPKFSKHFLPHLLAPSAVQSCINIQNIKPEEFASFLRSVYTENDFQDYSKTDYPWTEKVSWSFFDDNKSPLLNNKRHDFDDSLEDQNELDHVSSIHCDIVGVDGDENLTAATFIEKDNSSMEACCKIGQDLITLVDDSKFSDITFILDGQEKVQAHRAILCARSSYFSAMLFGDWSEKQATEIPLLGVSQQAFLIVLNFLYGGITRIPLEITGICEVLYLADMYGLEGLKDVVLCELKLVKCHLFHKPCSLCITGVIECLEVSDLFNLDELKHQCLRWTAKYFDRVCSTKGFANLCPKLQDESLSTIQASMNQLNVMDFLCRGDKAESSTPHIKWAEPILVFFSTLIDSCLSFIAANFPVVVSEPLFRDMIKGIGWSTPPVLEKVFMSVWNNLTIQNCCEQLKVAMRLRNMTKVAGDDDEEEHFSEEMCNLVEKLHTKCQNFVVSNLHRVTHTDGWTSLSPRTQTEIRKSKGGVFVDVGLPSQANRSFKSSSSKTLSNSLRPTTKKPDTNRTMLKNHSATRTSRSIRQQRPESTRAVVPGSSRQAVPGSSRQGAASSRPVLASNNKRPVSAPSSLKASKPTLTSSRPLRGVQDIVNSGQRPGRSGTSSAGRTVKESSRNKTSSLQRAKESIAKSFNASIASNTRTTKSNVNSTNASKTLNTKASASNSASVASNTLNLRTRNASQKLAAASKSDSNLSQNKKAYDSKVRRSYPDISQLRLPNENTTLKKKSSRLNVTVDISSSSNVTKSKAKSSVARVAKSCTMNDLKKENLTSSASQAKESENENENEEARTKLVHPKTSPKARAVLTNDETLQSEGSAVCQHMDDGIPKLESESYQEDSGLENTEKIEAAEDVSQLKDSDEAVSVQPSSEVSIDTAVFPEGPQ